MPAIYVANDNLLTVDLLRDERDAAGVYITTGTVSAQIKDMAGANVGGAITLSYVAASNGKWQGVIEDDVAIVANTRYVLHLDIAASSDRVAHLEIPATALRRTS